jgi:adenylate cyclase
MQVYQALSEAQGRGRGERELAILFTDLVNFSDWALEAGDAAALDLLRRVGDTVERGITEYDGVVVKRLGDGHMAAFPDPAAAVEAACAAQSGLDGIEVAGYRPALRAGVHLGRPRKLGGDYLGVDVNIAARVADAASEGEVLVSAPVLERLDPDRFEARRRRRFRAKGTPKDLQVYSVRPRR